MGINGDGETTVYSGSIKRPISDGRNTRFLETSWPDVPVMLMGTEGTGRKTWADYLMSCHNAIDFLSVKSEDNDWSFLKLATWLKEVHFATAQDIPRWASISLDRVAHTDQCVLLSLAEDLPENCRLIFRATPSVARALKERCCVVHITPPTIYETAELLMQQRIRRNEAVELATLRPGRPGLALALAEDLPLRGHFNGVLNAAEARDYTALASALMECPEGVRTWFKEWIYQSLALRPISHSKLAKEAGTKTLEICLGYLNQVPNPRLAVRAAATLLAVRK